MPQQKARPRAEYRRQQTLRIDASPSLAEKYGDLKSLTVIMEYYKVGGVRRITEIKYKVSLVNAKPISHPTNNGGQLAGCVVLTMLMKVNPNEET